MTQIPLSSTTYSFQKIQALLLVIVYCVCMQSALARKIPFVVFDHIEKQPHAPSPLKRLARKIMVSSTTPDAIVCGSGLAGLTVALNILDRGGKVVLLEKEAKVGGNSMKASSGINACVMDDDGEVELFVQDTMRSAGENANSRLIETLIHNSADALQWLKDRVGVDLLQNRTQLGGHSSARTHRPVKGAVGYTVMSAMQKALKPFEDSGQLEMLVSTRMTELIQQEKQEGRAAVTGINCITTTKDGAEEVKSIEASHVILATGGFAADRGTDSLLAEHCPEYLQMPVTFGDFSTGDGIKLATALGASTCLLDKLQVHPTGFVDPADPTSRSKFLCAELMRGLGGILLNAKGQRFCNELGNRSYVTDLMLEHEPHYASTHQWTASLPNPTFTLVLSADAVKAGGEHVGFYAWKKLLQPYKGIEELAKHMDVPVETLKASMEEYRQQASNGSDQYGKTVFPNVFSENWDEEEFYAGTVTPVLHYCMGGLTTDHEGNVLNEKQEIIEGLHAAGEVAGGVHGDNRLAGNSLLECLVFGSIIGKKLPIASDLPEEEQQRQNMDLSHLTQP